MRRDRLTFAMMVGIPIMQLMLFGFAINTDPKHLPTAVLLADHSDLGAHASSRALQNTGYFRVVRHRPKPTTRPTRMLARGEVQFVVTIPADFTPRPAARRAAGAAGRGRRHRSRRHRQRAGRPAHARSTRRSTRDLKGRLRAAAPDERRRSSCASTRRYNPEGITQYNIVPGPDGRDPDHDDGDDDGAGRSRANASAAPWRTCWRCRCGRSR